MLIKYKKNKIFILESQKLLTINDTNRKYSTLKNDQVIFKKNIPKKVWEVKQNFSFYDEEQAPTVNDMDFLTKKEFIEKLEINFGSLLSYEKILESDEKQIPLFNIVTSNNDLIMSDDLQNIYIKYFVKLLLKNLSITDILIDAKDYSAYFGVKSENLNFQATECRLIQTENRKYYARLNSSIKLFNNKEEGVNIIQCFKRASKGNISVRNLNMEGITMYSENQIHLVTFFKKFTIGVIKEKA